MKAKEKSQYLKESDIQNHICKYLQLQYPGIKYRSDKDGVFVGWNAIRQKQKQGGETGFPDLIIREARKGFNALVIELKKDDKSPFKKDGTLRSDEHLEKQQEWLDWFTSMGCKAQFSVGFDATKELIDWYLK